MNDDNWISVRDKLPVFGQYLLFCGIGINYIPTRMGIFLGGTENNIEFFDIIASCADIDLADQYIRKDVTHWMPLPHTPKRPHWSV